MDWVRMIEHETDHDFILSIAHEADFGRDELHIFVVVPNRKRADYLSKMLLHYLNKLEFFTKYPKENTVVAKTTKCDTTFEFILTDHEFAIREFKSINFYDPAFKTEKIEVEPIMSFGYEPMGKVENNLNVRNMWTL